MACIDMEHPRRASRVPLKGATLAARRSRFGGVLALAPPRSLRVGPLPGLFGLREFAQVLADAEHGSQLSEIRNPVFLRMAVE